MEVSFTGWNTFGLSSELIFQLHTLEGATAAPLRWTWSVETKYLLNVLCSLVYEETVLRHTLPPQWTHIHFYTHKGLHKQRGLSASSGYQRWVSRISEMMLLAFLSAWKKGGKKRLVWVNWQTFCWSCRGKLSTLVPRAFVRPQSAAARFPETR